jgi:hypothetical protein
VIVTIQLRRGTTAEWAAENPVLHLGEPGYDRDLGILKIGDGVTPWAELTGSVGGVSDHDELLGLADDDHPQYLTEGRGDARYYTQAQVLSLLPTGALAALDQVGPAQIADTGVAPGTYTAPNLTIDAQGRITAADDNVVSEFIFVDAEYTASPNTYLYVDTSGGEFPIYLPEAAEDEDFVEIHPASAWSTHNVFVRGGTLTVAGNTVGLKLNVDSVKVRLVRNGDDWQLVL